MDMYKLMLVFLSRKREKQIQEWVIYEEQHKSKETQFADNTLFVRRAFSGLKQLFSSTLPKYTS